MMVLQNSRLRLPRSTMTAATSSLREARKKREAQMEVHGGS